MLKSNKATITNDQEPPLTAEDLALLQQAEQDLAAFKKLNADNAQKLIERGQLLEQVTAQTTELKEETSELKVTAHQVEHFEERFAQARDHHLISLMMGLGGLVFGAGYALLMGYAWPLMIVFGIMGGSLAYGLSTLVTKFQEKIVKIGDWFKGFSLFNNAFSEHDSPSPLPRTEQAHGQSYERAKNRLLQYRPKPQTIASEERHKDQDLQTSQRLRIN